MGSETGEQMMRCYEALFNGWRSLIVRTRFMIRKLYGKELTYVDAQDSFELGPIEKP